MTDDSGGDPTRRNRLDEEESPYLRQHADNPVHWQPWDEQALTAARERDVPIFLSIGYSACHWCHVMEEESFEDEAVAATLNEQFVPIKVDREERPDLDSVYQTVCQLVTGRGGWPLSVWLTPEGKPFFVGTYFPNESRRGQPGFGDLLERIAASWHSDDRAEMENRAEQWTAAARDQLETVPEGTERPTSDLLTDAAGTILRGADREYGGFGSGGPKFPQPARLHLLLRAYDRTGRDTYREVVTETLDAMANGGMYDHVGGGFHRYATDRDWTVPHFEKMLYDNAELPRVYLAGYQVTGDERYATVARETFDFVARELTHPGGGFYSTLDARSPDFRAVDADATDPDDLPREEGSFYTWTPAEVRAVLDESAADLFCARYGVDERGNFEGTTVLTVDRSLDDLADEFDGTPTALGERLDAARDALFDAREERPRPRRDEKVLAGWNGLMVDALAEGALVLGDDAYAAMATDALDFVREHLWDGDAGADGTGRLARRFKDGDVEGEGYLEDYAFLARGALTAYEATGDVDHLAFALALARTVHAEFWDAEAETLYFTPASGEDLVTRPQEARDQSTPASLGVAVDVLLSLDHFAPELPFGDVAETVLERYGQTLRSNPTEHPTLAACGDRLVAGDVELTVVADALPEAWRAAVAGRYLPDRLLSLRPADEATLADWVDRLGVGDVPPIWADRDQRDNEPTAYACRSYTCSPPETDVEAALDWVAQNAPAPEPATDDGESDDPTFDGL